jgi:hypothetical protein
VRAVSVIDPGGVIRSVAAVVGVQDVCVTVIELKVL